MKTASANLGGLRCVIVDEIPHGESPRWVVILSHGFGASGTDLVQLGPELLARIRRPESVAFVFPAAPMSLESLGLPDGRAWWPINTQQLAEAVARGEYDSLRNAVPPGLSQARERFLEMLTAVQSRWGIGFSQCILAGFSQGAMLSTDVAIRSEQAPTGLGVFSGTLICEEEWRAAAPPSGVEVFQTHGRFDPLLPFQAALPLRDMFTEFGWKVDFHPFDGPHTIPMSGLESFAAFLNRIREVD